MSADDDVVYAVRQSEKNDELRMSLRSLGNFPHRRVFIAGYCPSWVRNATAIPVPRGVNKFDNIQRNFMAAVRHPELSEHFTYWNDDFYVMTPIDEIPVMHRGPVDPRHFAQELRTRIITTIRELPTVPHPLDYELHVPLPLETECVRMIMASPPPKILLRTYVANTAQLGGFEALDVKSRHGEVHDSALLSSSPRAFNSLRPYLDERLPRSMYE